MSDYQIKVEAKNTSEAKLIEKALKEPDIKAFICIVGVLKELPEDKRKQVLDYTKSRKLWYDLQQKTKCS